MSRSWRYYEVTHRHHVFCNPVSEAKVDELVDRLPLEPGASVLEIASGKGELACRIAARHGAEVVGVDLHEAEVAVARENAKRRGLEDLVDFVHSDGKAHEAPEQGHDLVCLVGASWIWSGYAGTLAALMRWTKPGGLVLVGEPYWRAEPPTAYLEHEELTADTFSTFGGNVRIAEDAGLRLLWATGSNLDDWDRYEFLQACAAELHLRENPEDEEAQRIAAQSREDRHAYLAWGRDCFGFGTYLFLAPGA